MIGEGGGPGLPLGTPDAVALESANSAWTFEELDAAASALARRIEELRSDGGRVRIGHAFDLSAEGLVVIHAVARTDAVLAPAHVDWTPRQIERFTATVNPTAMLVSPGRAWPGQWDRHSVSLPGFRPIDLLLPTGRLRQGRAAPAGTDAMISTSGSGGTPRTVCHSWAGLRANASAANARAEATSEDVTLATLAWSHIGGLGVVVRAAEAGSRVVCGPGRFDAAEVGSALVHHRVTLVSVVPVMLERLVRKLEAPPESLRRTLVGGAAVAQPLLEQAVEAGWPVSLTYGMTEMGSQVATVAPGGVATAVKSGDGRFDLRAHVLEGFDVRLADDRELLVSGPSMMLGTLEGGSVDADGWHPTGDLGAEGAEGILEIVGRRANRLVSGGTNVDPEEVEAVLLAHPEVAAACVTGVPDDSWGDLVVAVMVAGPALDPGTDQEPLGTHDLVVRVDAWSRERLDGPRRPRRWRIVDALPQTATGKVDRAAVRSLWIDEPPGDAGHTTETRGDG